MPHTARALLEHRKQPGGPPKLTSRLSTGTQLKVSESGAKKAAEDKVLLAKQAFDALRFVEAERQYATAIDLYAADGIEEAVHDTLCARVEALVNLDRYEEAVQDASLAVELRASFKACFLLAGSLYAHEEYQKALAECEKILKVRPDLEEVQKLKESILVKKGNTKAIHEAKAKQAAGQELEYVKGPDGKWVPASASTSAVNADGDYALAVAAPALFARLGEKQAAMDLEDLSADAGGMQLPLPSSTAAELVNASERTKAKQLRGGTTCGIDFESVIERYLFIPFGFSLRTKAAAKQWAHHAHDEVEKRNACEGGSGKPNGASSIAAASAAAKAGSAEAAADAPSTPVAKRGGAPAATPKSANSLSELQEKEKEQAKEAAEYVKGPDGKWVPKAAG